MNRIHKDNNLRSKRRSPTSKLSKRLESQLTAEDSVRSHDVEVERIAKASIKTQYFGTLDMYCFRITPKNEEVLVLTAGTISAVDAPLVRIQSSCTIGEVFGSLSCECKEQLELALEKIQSEGTGIIIYLNQEGRGLGLAAKVRAAELAESEGLDTVDAYLRMQLVIDNRSYEAAIGILKYLGLKKVRLLTNNPAKINALSEANLEVIREPIEIPPNPWNHDYLRTKKMRMGHLLDNI